MRTAFVNTLISLAQENENIVLITGDLGFGVLKPFWEKFPDRFINAGIAEQNMLSVAAGMALEGKTVFAYSIGNFPTLRAIEQIRNDCAYNHANVKIVCVGGGLVYGSLGMSHHATEDIAAMRALPDVKIYCPADAREAEAVTREIANTDGTCYLRLGRGGEAPAHSGEFEYIPGRAIKVCDGKRVAVFSTGGIFDEVSLAAKILNKNSISPAVFTFPCVKPIDKELIKACTSQFELIVTVEEHNITGGFGSAVAEVLAECAGGARQLRIGMQDIYARKVGSQRYLRREYGMDGESIANIIMENLG